MDFDVAASKIERYDAVNNRLLQTLDADPLMVDDPENTLACSLLETIPEFSYDDADLILDVVEQYLRLIDGDEETKRKITLPDTGKWQGNLSFAVCMYHNDKNYLLLYNLDKK